MFYLMDFDQAIGREVGSGVTNVTVGRHTNVGIVRLADDRLDRLEAFAQLLLGDIARLVRVQRIK